MSDPTRVRSPRFLGAARWWVRRELRRTLNGLQVAGLDDVREVVARHPVIFAANHVSFWDVFLVIALDEALGTEGFALMDADNLCRIPFFARLGAIPMRRGSPRAGMRAAAALLDRERRAVWIFPQGRHRPAHLRPLDFRPGVALLARLAPSAAVVPVALQYAYREHPNPVCFACFGEPLPAEAVAGEPGVEALEIGVADALGRIDEALAVPPEDLKGPPAGFVSLVPSRTWSANQDVGTRVLNALLRPSAAERGRGGAA